MKTLFIAALLSISIVGIAQTGQKNFIDQNYIEVTGKAEMEIVPDMIYLKIILSDKDNRDKLTLPLIEKKMIERLSAIGVDTEKDMSLLTFSSNLRGYWLKTNVVALTKQYQLIVRDAKTLQQAFFEFQNMGIANASVERLNHSQIEAFRKEVKVNAMKAAKEKAEFLAKGIDQEIGRALYIQEADERNPYLISNQAGVFQGATKTAFSSSPSDAITADNIDFEKIKVESTILVRFELK